jgi:hypothetical protein
MPSRSYNFHREHLLATPATWSIPSVHQGMRGVEESKQART